MPSLTHKEHADLAAARRIEAESLRADGDRAEADGNHDLAMEHYLEAGITELCSRIHERKACRQADDAKQG